MAGPHAYAAGLVAVVLTAVPAAGPVVTIEPEPTIALPPLGLAELSGFTASAAHEGVLWAVDDGAVDDDDRSRTRAFDAAGDLVGVLTLDATWNNRDTEAVAVGPGPEDGGSVLWIADIGDNDAVRDSVVVHTVPEPEIGDAEQPSEVEASPVSYRFRYPDGPRDAETFVVDPVDGRAYVVSKSIVGSGSLYALPVALLPGGPQGSAAAEVVNDVELVGTVPGWVTDGSFTPDGRYLVLLAAALLRPDRALVYAVTRPGGGAPAAFAQVAEVGLPSLRQAEALTVTRDGASLLVSGEGLDPVWSVPLPAGFGTEPTTDASATASAPSPTASEPSPSPTVAADSAAPPWGWLAGAAALLAGAGMLGFALARRQSRSS